MTPETKSALITVVAACIPLMPAVFGTFILVESLGWRPCLGITLLLWANNIAMVRAESTS